MHVIMIYVWFTSIQTHTKERQGAQQQRVDQQRALQQKANQQRARVNQKRVTHQRVTVIQQQRAKVHTKNSS